MFSRVLRVACASALLLGAPVAAFAQVDAIRRGVDAAAAPAGIQTTSCQGTQCIVTLIGNAVNIALSFLGVVLLVYLLYAGFLWTTSGGESKRAGEAAVMIRNAVIGLLITVSAFAISGFVVSQLGAITDASATPAASAPAPSGNTNTRQGGEPGVTETGVRGGPRGPTE